MISKYVWLAVCILSSGCSASPELREKTIELVGQTPLAKWLSAPVRIEQADSGILKAADEGVYIFQYNIETPAVAAEPNVIIDKNVVIASSADKLVIVVHGWLNKSDRWSVEMAEAIRAKTDPNEWLCGCYDWSGGSMVITSVHAARYARDIAGPRLAAAILKLPCNIRHIHLLAHSAGSWVIDAAAKRIAKTRPGTSFHLTFFDAYVPMDWEPNELADIPVDPNHPADVWAEHYYTRDITYKVTEADLAFACNLDITALDPLIVEHEFPYRWYLATITGSYDRWDEKSQTVYTSAGGIEYGFTRSLETGRDNWQKSLKLPKGEKGIKMRKED